MSHQSFLLILVGRGEVVSGTLDQIGRDQGRGTAEEAEAEDLQKGDFLVLASGTWNDGGVEGQLNMHMADLLKKRADDLDLAEQKCALISLGDDRYYYTARATEHLMQYFMNHNGKNSCPPLLVINEPFGQEDKVEKWGDQLFEAINA